MKPLALVEGKWETAPYTTGLQATIYGEALWHTSKKPTLFRSQPQKLGVLPFAQEYVLSSPVGLKGNLSLLKNNLFSRGLSKLKRRLGGCWHLAQIIAVCCVGILSVSASMYCNTPKAHASAALVSFLRKQMDSCLTLLVVGMCFCDMFSLSLSWQKCSSVHFFILGML